MRRKQVGDRVRYRKRVLVVEDDSWNRWVMRDILSDEGYEVIEAADGRTGLRLVEEYSPDIVLLDIAMPDFTGVDVLHHLRSRRRTRNLPVVIVSAYPRVLPPSDAATVTSIFVKPVRLDDLLAVIREALGLDERLEPAPAEVAV